MKRKVAQQNLALAPPAILVHYDEKFEKKEFSVSFQNALLTILIKRKEVVMVSII